MADARLSIIDIEGFFEPRLSVETQIKYETRIRSNSYDKHLPGKISLIQMIAITNYFVVITGNSLVITCNLNYSFVYS